MGPGHKVLRLSFGDLPWDSTSYRLSKFPQFQQLLLGSSVGILSSSVQICKPTGHTQHLTYRSRIRFGELKRSYRALGIQVLHGVFESSTLGRIGSVSGMALGLHEEQKGTYLGYV